MDHRVLYLGLVLEAVPWLVLEAAPPMPWLGWLSVPPLAVFIAFVIPSAAVTVVGLLAKGRINQDQAGGLAFLGFVVAFASTFFMLSTWVRYGDLLSACGVLPQELLLQGRCSSLQQDALL